MVTFKLVFYLKAQSVSCPVVSKLKILLCTWTTTNTRFSPFRLGEWLKSFETITRIPWLESHWPSTSALLAIKRLAGVAPERIWGIWGTPQRQWSTQLRCVYTFRPHARHRHSHRHRQSLTLCLWLMSRMGSRPFLPVRLPVTIHTMLNFDGDCDGDGHGVGKCKHTLRWSTPVLKPRPDVASSPRQGISGPTKTTNVLRKLKKQTNE